MPLLSIINYSNSPNWIPYCLQALLFITTKKGKILKNLLIHLFNLGSICLQKNSLQSLASHYISMSLQTRSSCLLLLTLFFFFFFIIIIPIHSIPSKSTCLDKCGTIPIRYPFGSASGCGHPQFSRYITCDPHGSTLHFSTATGVYTVSSIDYSAATLVVTDPLMSTCSSMQNSGGFSLGPGPGPFSLASDNIFVLVGCSRTSPVFDRSGAGFCEEAGSGLDVCRGLYSCKGVEGIGLEKNAAISSCCVYSDPRVGVGVGGVDDLAKLQCSSYSGVYGFGGSEGDPMKWEYGILLRYNDSSDYYNTGSSSSSSASSCKNCEESGGFCGFYGVDEAFSCKCRNGVNTTTNCYGRG